MAKARRKKTTSRPRLPLDGPIGWVTWLYRSYLHMAANGTPHYRDLGEGDRREFEEIVGAGEWFAVLEGVKRKAVAEACDAGLELPEEALSELSAWRVRFGVPLPREDSQRLERIATKLYAVIVKLDVLYTKPAPVTSGPAAYRASIPETWQGHGSTFATIDGKKLPIAFTETEHRLLLAIQSARPIGMDTRQLKNVTNHHGQIVRGLELKHKLWKAVIDRPGKPGKKGMHRLL